jgi:uncharacterized membrane protein YeaQ/YmgE (transglycosylase-associated protein family)
MTMALILLIVTGAALGWLASIMLRIEHSHGIAANLAVGVVGATVGGLVLSPMLGGGNPLSGIYGPVTLLLSFLTAGGALAVFGMASSRAIR